MTIMTALLIFTITTVFTAISTVSINELVCVHNAELRKADETSDYLRFSIWTGFFISITMLLISVSTHFIAVFIR